jgi:hypothetical protein
MPNGAPVKLSPRFPKTRDSFKSSSQENKPCEEIRGSAVFLTATRPYLKRLSVMSDFQTSQTQQPDGATKVSQTGARQGLTGMGVRYVLATSLVAVVIAFAAAYFFFGF